MSTGQDSNAVIMTRPAITDSDGKNSTSKVVENTPKELSIELGFETVTAPNLIPPLEPAQEILEAGAIPEIKNLYKGEASCVCCITWDTEPQKKLPTTATTTTGGYAILARRTEGHGDFGQESKLHSIVIQSAFIMEVLGEALKGYPGITPELESLTVEAPFSAFYHRWTALNDAHNASADDTATHLDLLIKLLKDEFEIIGKKVAGLLKNKVIEFKYIWAIFQPGDYIFTKIHGQDAVLLLEDGCNYDETQHKSGKGWTLKAKHIDYDGSVTGFVTTLVKIPEFKGTISLTELDAYPLDMHHDKDALVKKLVLRGKVFASLRVWTCLEHAGKAYTKDESGYGAETQVNGRVMVDSLAYFQFNRHKGVPLRALDAPSPSTTAHIHKPPVHGHIHKHGPRPPPLAPAHQYVVYSGNLTVAKKARPDESEQTKLSDKQLLICIPFVRGYSFKNKEWVLLNIDLLRSIQWTKDLFENLVLPTDEKDVLLALVRSHSKAAVTFDDFVVGKGKGMIILLEGPPGTGKTLTAESVAEAMQAPLYTMSAGELGTQADRVEKHLSDILKMATMWKAILLIDEADIFMEERSPYDLERNELVSIFLRQLEYYKGVMILTTNRVESMDRAFDSRVDIRLHYPTLDTAARRKVWFNFTVKFLGDLSIDKADLDTLAEHELDGRQIKSAMKTAHLLASDKGEITGFRHIQTVLKITKGETGKGPRHLESSSSEN